MSHNVKKTWCMSLAIYVFCQDKLLNILEEAKMWDIARDSFEDEGLLEVISLSLKESELEAVVFSNDGDEDQAQNF